MKKRHISKPMDFEYKDGNVMEKTFDLSGDENDQMLKTYLRRAGLSDNIEHLSPEQRKAFIYDIVKSNKHPGYWKPSVLPQVMPSFANAPNQTEDPLSSETLMSLDDIPPASLTIDSSYFSRLRTSSAKVNVECSTISKEQRSVVRGSLYERQFQQQKNISNKNHNVTPVKPQNSTLITRKGRKIEVSGPTNFRHISGDMNRDKTKNAFDLAGQSSDNLLKKYMFERGITEDQVRHFESKELIRKIVQSGYTWMPCCVENGKTSTPPPPSEIYVAPTVKQLSFPEKKELSKGGALIVPPPVLPANYSSSSENIYSEITPVEKKIPKAKKHPTVPPPPPPPQKPKRNITERKIPTPPPLPPQLLVPAEDINKFNTVFFERASSVNKNEENLTETKNKSTLTYSYIKESPSQAQDGSPLNGELQQHVSIIHNTSKSKGTLSPPSAFPTPSIPQYQPPIQKIPDNTYIPIPPPPPPPPPSTETNNLPGLISSPKHISDKKTSENEIDKRDAFLESIRLGVTLKKVRKDDLVKNNLDLPNENKLETQSVAQKSITSGTTDFMSELRNATLKRIKKLQLDTYDDGNSESNC